MAKRAFDGIMAGLQEALAHAEGKKSGVRLRKVAVPVVDVKAARTKLGLSQGKFALLLGVPVPTLRKWEQGQRHPTGAARTLLKIIARHPEAVVDVVGND
jgi:putative transcriptional regulator